MPAAIVKVTFNEEDVLVETEKAAEKEIQRLGFEILGKAQQNIVANDQIDTGFLLNSGYVVVGDAVDTYSRVRSPGLYTDRGGKTVRRDRVDRAPLGKAVGLVAFAAAYAIWQELRKSFLYRAAEQTKE